MSTLFRVEDFKWFVRGQRGGDLQQVAGRLLVAEFLPVGFQRGRKLEVGELEGLETPRLDGAQVGHVSVVNGARHGRRERWR